MHIYDKDFIRDKLPMTKQEIRAVSIAKLMLKKNDILIDVGAGTGTIGVEAATYLSDGKVIAIEKEESGIENIKQNYEKFNLKNYEIINGLAPQNLPNIEYDAMFIGGSSKNMENIIKHFIDFARKGARLVINAITLETLNESIDILKKYFSDIEIVNLSVSRAKKVGPYNMMMAENPIYIIKVVK